MKFKTLACIVAAFSVLAVNLPTAADAGSKSYYCKKEARRYADGKVAGNVVGEAGLGTLEYAIRHLDVHLVVVMGHEACGAVAAALLPEERVAQEPENLQALIRRIQPSVQNMPPIRDKKARMREAVLNNVRHQVSILREQAVIQEAEAAGQIRVIGAYYEIGSGAVDFLIDEEDLRP